MNDDNLIKNKKKKISIEASFLKTCKYFSFLKPRLNFFKMVVLCKNERANERYFPSVFSFKLKKIKKIKYS